MEYLLKQKEKYCDVEHKTLVPENNLDYALVSAYENKKKEEKIFKNKKVKKRKRSAMVEKEKIPVRENNMKVRILFKSSLNVAYYKNWNL